MPLLHLFTTRPVAPAALRDLSRQVADLVGKPERWVMVTVTPPAAMVFAGTTDPACYAELKSVGQFARSDLERISAALCPTIGAATGAPPDRVYVEITGADGAHWAWNGETFAD